MADVPERYALAELFGTSRREMIDHIPHCRRLGMSGNLQVRAVSPALEALPDRLQQLGSRLSLTAFAVVLSISAAIPAPTALRRDLRSALFLLCITLAVSAWTVLPWWTVLGRGRPLRLTRC